MVRTRVVVSVRTLYVAVFFQAGYAYVAYRDFHSRDEATYLAQTRQLLDE